jgi:hypothetical protein
MGAIISPDKQYRYWLTRQWNVAGEQIKSVVFAMLNPSIADAELNDNTIRRCISYAMSWGYNELIVVNMYAYRATDPTDLFKCHDPIGPDNNNWLWVACQNYENIICGWGKPAQKQRVDIFKQIAAREKIKLMCLGTNQDGSPRHPLYMKKDLKPIPFNNNRG